jgi:hypothetical protein
LNACLKLIQSVEEEKDRTTDDDCEELMDNNCPYQFFPCYLEAMQEDFLNGDTTGICPYVKLLI